MSNWPKDTTKRDEMTNKELADAIGKASLVGNGPVMEHLREAISRLRELPEPEPVKDLPWLVERHECLSRHLAYMPGMDYGPWSWDYRGDNTSGSIITGYAARVVVRGIVKGLCDKHGGIWATARSDKYAGKWYHNFNANVRYHDTELEAIDALLTAMEESK